MVKFGSSVCLSADIIHSQTGQLLSLMWPSSMVVWVYGLIKSTMKMGRLKTRCGLKTANTVSKHRTLANYGEMQARITRFTSHRRFNIGISVTIIRIGLLTFNGIHTVRRFRINLNKFTANLTFSFVPEMMLSS